MTTVREVCSSPPPRGLEVVPFEAEPGFEVIPLRMSLATYLGDT
jgi:hypothetical protein